MAAARYTRNQGYVVTRKQRASRATMRTTARRFSIGPTAAKFAGVAVLGVLGVMLANFNVGAQGDVYHESQVRRDISDAEARIDRLRYEADRAQSLSQLQQTDRSKDLVPNGNAEHISPETGQVAGVSTDSSITQPSPSAQP